MATPLINGITYDWGSIVVSIAGIPVMGIQEINYTETQEIVNNYGAGRYPVSRSKGRVTSTASMTLDAAEIEALQSASVTGRLHDVPPFDIIVTYTTDTQKIAVHTLRDCQIVNNARQVKENDKQISIKLDLIVSRIDWKTKLF